MMQKYKIVLLLTLLLLSCQNTNPEKSDDNKSNDLLTESQMQTLELNGYCIKEQSYTFCQYNNTNGDTEIVIQKTNYSNFNDVNGSYQYESLHLRGFNGLIEENQVGDFSRYYVNNESEVYYYHLWIIDNLTLFHITSKGSVDAGTTVIQIGEMLVN